MNTAPNHRFVRFLLGGAVNTAITWLLFVILARYMSATRAYTLTYLVGISLAYAINSRFVFGFGLSLRTAWRYPLVYVAQYAYGLAAVNLLVERLELARALVIVFVTISALPITFFLSRLLLSGRDTGGFGFSAKFRTGKPYDRGAVAMNAGALPAHDKSVMRRPEPRSNASPGKGWPAAGGSRSDHEFRAEEARDDDHDQ